MLNNYLFHLLIFFLILPNESAREIIKKADKLMRGDTEQGVYQMIVVRPTWQRSMRFKFWSEGDDKFFIHILEPAKDRGINFLRIKNEMWQYIPKINRTIKIPPSMMLQSWMGSDFTNDDLVKESSLVDDYTHTLVGHDTIRGFEAYKIELKPKEKAAVVWDRIIEWIRVDDYVPLKAQYFNERGELVRTLVFNEIKKMDDRVIPTRMELIEEKKPGRKTILILEKVKFNRAIRSSIFTLHYLKRAR